MIVIVSIPRKKYRRIRSHLFQDYQEQGCFLFAKIYFSYGVVNLQIKEIYFVKSESWVGQHAYHLELPETEKVKIMRKARKYDYDVIECHSHPFATEAQFSSSDTYGLAEFIQYVWWKLPGKIYGALVWTENDVDGQIWMPNKVAPLPIREIRITN